MQQRVCIVPVGRETMPGIGYHAWLRGRAERSFVGVPSAASRACRAQLHEHAERRVQLRSCAACDLAGRRIEESGSPGHGTRRAVPHAGGLQPV